MIAATVSRTSAQPETKKISRLATYIANQIDALSGIKTQREIAREAGFEKPNIISMFKTGEAKLPLDRVPGLARAMNVDPAFLFRLAMQDYWPNLEATIADVFGTLPSKNEVEILARIRELSGDTNPGLNAELDAKLTAAFQKD